ncbi:Pseudouridine synthase [Pseudoloma neurophilia]|uniref:H/ACA ribonucleoprotein complex subunit CBF5 n=1 Tax=Pseudoloma neurophilia TaxID=146866 RepID=A0A0R0M2J8_9MICR|nr:Pseudouridine synthase [Pseudoloma neurophilia]
MFFAGIKKYEISYFENKKSPLVRMTPEIFEVDMKNEQSIKIEQGRAFKNDVEAGKSDGSQNENKNIPESVLLYDIDKMIKISSSFTQQNRGMRPESRPIKEYLNHGVVYLDKPKNPSSHEVVTWIKNMFKNVDIEKTGHGGTLDPQVSGVLAVYLNRGTRLCTIAQHAGKEYVAICKIEGKASESEIKKALQFFTGKLIQRPPEICAVKRNLRIREVKENTFIESKTVDKDGKHVTYALFKTSCQAGTYIRTLCQHIGYFLGFEASMVDLRRTRSGQITEDQIFTMHDLQDAIYMFEKHSNETYLRRVVHPIEMSLKHYKRIIVKDSAVNALCSGAKLTVCGVVLIDQGINQGDTVVCITLKGEAVCLSTAILSSTEIKILDHGFVAKTTRVIMEKDTYDDAWGAKKFNWF